MDNGKFPIDFVSTCRLVLTDCFVRTSSNVNCLPIYFYNDYLYNQPPVLGYYIYWSTKTNALTIHNPEDGPFRLPHRRFTIGY